MSDLIDCACEREQHDRDLCLAAALKQQHTLPYIGQCYNCEATLPEGVRFCDCDCRNDYTNRKRCEALR